MTSPFTAPDKTDGHPEVRWSIAFLVGAAIAISYLDRQRLPWAIQAIQADIPFSNEIKAGLDSAFLATYGLMYLGGGLLLGRLGTRRGFLCIMIFWSQDILTCEDEMCHGLANLEHHHFKFAGHSRPGDRHVHFYGACSLSFGAGIELAEGDIMEISFAGFGRPLRNPLQVAAGRDTLVAVNALA